MVPSKYTLVTSYLGTSRIHKVDLKEPDYLSWRPLTHYAYQSLAGIPDFFVANRMRTWEPAWLDYYALMISLALQQYRTDYVIDNIFTMMRAGDLGSIVSCGGDKSQVIAQDIAIHFDKG